MAFLKWFLYQLNYLVRYTYWLYNLSKATIGEGSNFHFPVKVEGGGKLLLGSNSLIEKGVEIGVGKGAFVAFGIKSKLASHTLIRIAPNKTFRTGENTLINQNSQLYIHNDWEFGDNVSVATHCSIVARESGYCGKFSVGNGVSIGDNAIIDLSGDITIGNNVALGPNCIIYTHDHNYKENRSVPWHGKPVVQAVKVGDGCWVGAGVIILPGITVGEGSIVASGAVVTKDVEAFSMVGGVPAKLLKKLT